MKIQGSIRNAYDYQLGVNTQLQKTVNAVFENSKNKRWHFESRVKEIESFAVKLETGRVRDPFRLEDFLGCTLVVSNSSEIDDAIALVRKHFSVKYRRPKKPGETHKAADAFPFDDIRLYVQRKPAPGLPLEPIDEVIFEVQVKTFLQHAWSIATHDITYKTDNISWGKDRVAAHLKAALEHIELSLKEADSLAKSSAVALNNEKTTHVAMVADILIRNWKRADLPKNLRALAQAVSEVLKVAEMSPKDLDDLLQAAKKKGNSVPLNLSPYGAILSMIIGSRAEHLDMRLSELGKPTVLLTPEISLPANFPSDGAKAGIIQLT